MSNHNVTPMMPIDDLRAAWNAYVEVQALDREHCREFVERFERFGRPVLHATNDEQRSEDAGMDAYALEMLRTRDWSGVMALLSSRVRQLGYRKLRRFMTPRERRATFATLATAGNRGKN
jgi:hypothetical protein